MMRDFRMWLCAKREREIVLKLVLMDQSRPQPCLLVAVNPLVESVRVHVKRVLPRNQCLIKRENMVHRKKAFAS
jgi:hypothetical protein